MGVTMLVATSHCLCWALGGLAVPTRHTKIDPCLFGVCGPLRDFLKVRRVVRDQPLGGTAAERGSRWACKLDGTVSGNHPGGARVVLASLMETQAPACACPLWMEWA